MTLPLSSDQVGSFVHRKNAIINGDMRIAQRGTSFAAIVNASFFLIDTNMLNLVQEYTLFLKKIGLLPLPIHQRNNLRTQ